MYMENIRSTIIVVGVFLIYLTGLLSSIPNSKPTLDWFEAQEICKVHGGISTETGLSNQEYWTGRYKRLSPWIKIIGCYPDFDIMNHTQQVQKRMAKKSVGACQEICKYEKSLTFAVKLHVCTCLKGIVTFESMTQYLPSKCNFNCDNKDGIYSEDCGGEKAHNVYISEEGNKQDYIFDKNNCMSLQCSPESHIYIRQSCTKDLDKICQNSKTSEEGAVYNSWTISFNICKNLSSYLYGDLDLTNASGHCQTLPTGESDLRWVGIARQEYTYEDQGWIIEENEKKHFRLCEKCTNKAKCSFYSCDHKITNDVFCSNKTTTEITVTGGKFTTATISSLPSINTEQITVVTNTTSFAEKQTTTTTTQVARSTLTGTQPNPQLTKITGTTSSSKQQQTSVETNPATVSENPQAMSNAPHITGDNVRMGILIPIILGIVFPVLAVALLIIYIRHRNMRKSSKDKNKKTQKLNGVNRTKVDNPSYFVIEKTSYELANNRILDSDESPYNETEEGDYDLLRNKGSRKKDVEDTYQHAVINGDISHYDSTTTNQKQGLKNTERMINRSKNEEPSNLEGDNSTYSEVDNMPDSAYFVLENPSPYELADNSVIDSESTYNEAVEGDYDHLRNKGSRKKDVEDTYQHATFDSKRDISDYDTSPNDQKQEFESTYDHMHESLNLNRNSDYGYNSIDPNVQKEGTCDKTVKSI